MAYINVKRDVTDQFYRYKMPLLIAKVSPLHPICGVLPIVVKLVELCHLCVCV